MKMTMAFNSDIEVLKELTGQDDWVYTVPEGRSAAWIDCWSIPSNQNSNELALEFMSFLNQPSIAAKNAEDIWLSSTHLGAVEFLNEDYLLDATVNPSLDTLSQSDRYPPFEGEAIALRNWLLFSVEKRFDEFKSGR